MRNEWKKFFFLIRKRKKKKGFFSSSAIFFFLAFDSKTKQIVWTCPFWLKSRKVEKLKSWGKKSQQNREREKKKLDSLFSGSCFDK